MTATIDTVIDSPEFVFQNWTSDVLNNQFMDYAETDLVDTAVAVLGTLLAAEWEKRGLTMLAVKAVTFDWIVELNADDILPTAPTVRDVWDAAVDKLDFDDIVKAAGLTAEYATFVRAQPDYNY